MKVYLVMDCGRLFPEDVVYRAFRTKRSAKECVQNCKLAWIDFWKSKCSSPMPECPCDAVVVGVDLED